MHLSQSAIMTDSFQMIESYKMLGYGMLEYDKNSIWSDTRIIDKKHTDTIDCGTIPLDMI